MTWVGWAKHTLVRKLATPLSSHGQSFVILALRWPLIVMWPLLTRQRFEPTISENLLFNIYIVQYKLWFTERRCTYLIIAMWMLAFINNLVSVQYVTIIETLRAILSRHARFTWCQTGSAWCSVTMNVVV